MWLLTKWSGGGTEDEYVCDANLMLLVRGSGGGGWRVGEGLMRMKARRGMEEEYVCDANLMKSVESPSVAVVPFQLLPGGRGGLRTRKTRKKIRRKEDDERIIESLCCGRRQK